MATSNRNSSQACPDPAMVRAAVELLVAPGDVVELRHIAPGWKGRKEIRSGYFDDPDLLVAAAQDCRGGNVYLTLNPVLPDLLARRANRIGRAGEGDTTSDQHVVHRRWLLIDADPNRPSGISSTEEEKIAAHQRVAEIAQWLKERGWPDPAIADSGNGLHLLYRIELANDDCSTSLTQRVLTSIADLHSDEQVTVDTSVFNASRITKLYGTVACKGDSTPDRPHRVSRLTNIPGELVVVTREKLELVAGPEPEPAASPRRNGQSNGHPFDLEAYLAQHLEVRSHSPYTNANGADYRWKLETCPLCGESDNSAVVLRFSDGRIGYRCHHNRCTGKGWRDLRSHFEPDRRLNSAQVRSTRPYESETGNPSQKPRVELPGGKRSISTAAREFGRLLAPRTTHFVRGGIVVRVARDEQNEPYLKPVKPAELASDLESVAQPVKWQKTNGGGELVPTTCGKSTGELIMSAQAFVATLPPLRILSRCPLLVERNGELIEVRGYDKESGILAEGQPAAPLELEQALGLLTSMLSGFRFATASDHSRAVAALITPALVLGGLLPGRAPIDLGEADQSQTGKGFRNKLTAAIYRHSPIAVSQRSKGIGSMEEAFDRALISGATFISLDNVRGKVESQAIESFLTEDSYTARCAYSPPTMIDPRRVYVMFTSNKADITFDLANRASCVRLLKQQQGYHFPFYPEGDVLRHVRTHQPKYLGAVFSVIRHWHAAGKPRTNETRHDFRPWAQVLDWIVQQVFELPPLMEGHTETQQRMTNPAMNWLRDVALAVVRHGEQGKVLIANDLLEIMDADGNIEIPGAKEEANLEEDTVRRQVWQQIGKRMKRCFGNKSNIDIDGLRIERCHFDDDRRHSRVAYQVTSLAVTDVAADRSAYEDARPLQGDGILPTDEVAADAAADPPLMGAADETRGSADAADTSLTTNQNGSFSEMRDVITPSADQGKSTGRTEVVL